MGARVPKCAKTENGGHQPREGQNASAERKTGRIKPTPKQKMCAKTAETENNNKKDITDDTYE